RVVDGGYYENFGAITALELAKELRSPRFNLNPKVIIINNEPTTSGMNCITPDARMSYPKPASEFSISTWLSPISAFMMTRTARGTLAAVDLCSDIGAENFAFITVSPDRRNLDKELSMSWWLSKHVQKHLDDQLGDEASLQNKRSLKKIQAWRSK
ncbi:MAG: hypothetical protein RLZ98_2247, partial [Pseudomonadota bacterium]